MNTREFTDKIGNYQQQVSDTARQWGTATDKYVRENTWVSIGVAALIGCVLGYIIASREESAEHEDSEERAETA